MKNFIRFFIAITFLAINLYGSEKFMGAEFQVNTHSSLDQTDPAISALAGGEFIICWTSDRQDGKNFGY